jgi:hypothetical protein
VSHLSQLEDCIIAKSSSIEISALPFLKSALKVMFDIYLYFTHNLVVGNELERYMNSQSLILTGTFVIQVKMGTYLD